MVIYCYHKPSLQSPRKLQIAIVGLGAHVATIFPNLHPKSNLVCIHKWSFKVDIINNIIIHLIIYTTSTMFIPKKKVVIHLKF
jgi:hypothetical protein